MINLSYSIQIIKNYEQIYVQPNKLFITVDHRFALSHIIEYYTFYFNTLNIQQDQTHRTPGLSCGGCDATKSSS